MRSQIVYAIYSHTNPSQVLRLVRAIRALSPNSQIVVHHDPSISRLTAEEVMGAGAIAIPNPVRGTWGDYSLVKQHLHTMQWCLNNLEFEWYITLTGQTYPIKRLQAFETSLKDSPYDAYISHFNAYEPSIWPDSEAARRYHYRYIKLPKFRYWHRIPKAMRARMPRLISLFNHSQPLLEIFSYPKGLPTRLGFLQWGRPFGASLQLVGSNLNANYRRHVLRRVVEYVSRHPKYERYFSRTALPDEVFFSTIVCNDHNIHIGNECLRHIFWPEQNSASVGAMDLTHWQDLQQSRAYFALKLDQTICPELLDKVDYDLGICLPNTTE